MCLYVVLGFLAAGVLSDDEVGVASPVVGMLSSFVGVASSVEGGVISD